MNQQRLIYMLFFVLVAVMMLYDLFFNNLPALLGRGGMVRTAAEFGISVGQAQIRLVVLSALGGLAAVGALLAAQAYLNPAAQRNGRIGVYVATAALAAYGLFNIVSAVFLMQSILRTPVLVTGFTYLILAGGIWYAGRSLRAIPPN